MHAVAETIHSRTWTHAMLHELVATRLGERKLIVVANREPYIHRYQDGRVECLRPASGMATALHPIMVAAGGTWIAHGSGDADRAAVDACDRVEVPPEDPAYSLRRVWLTREQEEGFYYGLSNEGLWPLCHMAFTRPKFRQKDWDAYREVNALFAQAVLEEAGDGPALVFIQDYHFALLPRMLKQMAGNRLVVAHFWHIPWPNCEIFRAFPWREELLDGLLGNDLLGFQVRYHCQNFLDTVDRAIEAKVDHERFQVTRHTSPTMVRPFPISIDFSEHSELAETGEVTAAMQSWREVLNLGDRQLGIGLERLDYTKGIPERLRALDHLLELHPEWRGRIVFAQVAVPSRVQLDDYQNIENEVGALVEQINRRWRRNDWEPVVLLKRHFGTTDMMALHRLARFCVVSSLHDGMNLVAKEFVASRVDEKGVLILSRFAGAHRELSDALEINPFAAHEVADAMRRALEMSGAEQRKRMKRLREQVAYNNVFRWAGKFLSALLKFELPENGQDTTLDESLGRDSRANCAAA
jgi:alpha,alpha-trehalose-phosphate synthase [UDP-forming]